MKMVKNYWANDYCVNRDGFNNISLSLALNDEMSSKCLFFFFLYKKYMWFISDDIFWRIWKIKMLKTKTFPTSD